MRKLLIALITVFCACSFVGCNDNINSLDKNQTSSKIIDTSSSKLADEIIIINSKGEKRIISADEKDMLEKSASIITQQILTFTAVPNTEKSVFPQDFTDVDIINFCISGGICSNGVRYSDFEYEDFYPYIGTYH